MPLFLLITRNCTALQRWMNFCSVLGGLRAVVTAFGYLEPISILYLTCMAQCQLFINEVVRMSSENC